MLIKFSWIGLILSLFLLTSCATSKQLPYFQDLSPDKAVTNLPTVPYESLRLQPNDELQITISSNSPEASQFFNLTSVSPGGNTNGGLGVAQQSQSLINVYRVASSGVITMPVLGEIQAAGLTTEMLKAVIGTLLKDYLKEAVVTVNLTNFKVTVIGEVGRPIVVPVNGQTINVLEAVGAAGDMTVYGLRRSVRVIRKLPNGNTEVAVLDFNNSSVLKSPYFQLHQNDIVYIEPSKNKGLQGTRTSLLVPIITSLVSITAIIITRN